MLFLRRNWLAVAVALFLGVALVRTWEAKRDAERWAERVVQLERDVARANERAVHWQNEAEKRSDIADSLRAEMARLSEPATEYITRWRTRVDTLTVEETVALADSAITACELALGSCAETVAALDATVAAQDSALVAVSEEREHLRTYARELQARLEGGDPLWTTPVAIGLGAGLGYALEGVDGVFVGAGLGLTSDILWRGTRSLIRSLP